MCPNVLKCQIEGGDAMYVARRLLDEHIPQLLLMTLRRVPRDIPMPLQMRSIFREHCRILGAITIMDACQDANKTCCAAI